MPPKRPPPPPSPSAPSSSGEEEEDGDDSAPSPQSKQKSPSKKPKSQPPPPAAPQPPHVVPTDQNSSSGNSESDDGDEDTGPGKYTVQPAAQKPKSSEQPASDESSSGSESDSEPESPPPKPITRSGDPTVKPINSKPMSTKDAGKAQPPPATPSRSAAEPSASDEEAPKKQPFQRLWSEESEMEILKGALDFMKAGRDPFTEMGAFYDHIRKVVDVSCSKSQLSDKLRRLKKKYENNVKRGKKGKDPEFSKAHEKTGYELSKQIWGSKKKLSDENKGSKANGPAKEEADDSKGEAPKASKSSRRVKKDKTVISLPEPIRSRDKPLSEETRNLILEVCSKEVDMSESIVKQAVDFIESSKANELVEMWREVKIMEMELFAKRSEFSKELMKSILEVLKD
ncbi:probable transcription factor At4g00390 [Aristolochia californica]|uniref:probable transcription factor At4g00390 n=1 Tax=Aristolochia californica TaxID=171875 RepID=UPI0035DDE14A